MGLWLWLGMGRAGSRRTSTANTRARPQQETMAAKREDDHVVLRVAVGTLGCCMRAGQAGLAPPGQYGQYGALVQVGMTRRVVVVSFEFRYGASVLVVQLCNERSLICV